jgi:hypothetical protein
MGNNFDNVPEYVKQLSMEATFRSNEDLRTYIYGYVTYNKTNLIGAQINNLQKYNIQAHGRIPITENEFLDMVLNTDKDDKILDFHTTYLRTFTANDNTLLGRKFKQAVRRLNIRTDIGPHKGHPHIDVEIFDVNNKKIEDKVVEQADEFTNYESTISAVFMQIERISNPLIGAQYWLSPFGIFPERIKKLAELKEQNGISTSLSVLSRMINVKLYEETRTGITIYNKQFWKVVKSQLQFCMEKENELGGGLDISQLRYTTEMSVLPFLFFVPSGAEYCFKKYNSNGLKMPLNGRPSALVCEKKNGFFILRDIDNNDDGSKSC